MEARRMQYGYCGSGMIVYVVNTVLAGAQRALHTCIHQSLGISPGDLVFLQVGKISKRLHAAIGAKLHA